MLKLNKEIFKVDSFLGDCVLIEWEFFPLAGLIKKDKKIYLYCWCEQTKFFDSGDIYIMSEVSYEDLADLKDGKKDLPDLINRNEYVYILFCYDYLNHEIHKVKSKYIKEWVPDRNPSIQSLLPATDWHLWGQNTEHEKDKPENNYTMP